MKSLKRIKIIVLFLSIIGFTSLSGCIKPEDVLAQFTCLQSKQDLYIAWGVSAPSRPCPYSESDQRKARLYFADNTSLDIVPGYYGNGGIFLQNLNCTQSLSSPLISYILIRFWATDPKGGSTVATFPINSCNAPTKEIIYLQGFNNTFKKLYTVTREFSYSEAGIRKIKLINSILFL